MLAQESRLRLSRHVNPPCAESAEKVRLRSGLMLSDKLTKKSSVRPKNNPPKKMAWSRSIKRAFDKGKSWQGAFFRVKVLDRHDGKQSRLAVIISKKTLPGAVERNRVRRRIKAAFAEYLQSGGLDIVVLPNKTALDGEFEKIRQEAEKCVNSLQTK